MAAPQFVCACLVTLVGCSSAPAPTVEPSTDSALEQARAGVQSNAEWQDQYPDGAIREFDDVAMVLVPAGCFQLGDDPEGIDWDGDSWEQGIPDGGRVCFDDPFWIDRTEVTQEAFARFDGIKAAPHAFPGANRPVENITWAEARNFCQQRGARLPTEAEWEYAARGVDGLLFPWGNDFVAEYTVWNRDPLQGTADVASLPAGASWVGAMDMSGNVWEWVSSLYLPYPYDARDGRETNTGENAENPRVLRGSSWYGDHTPLLRAALRDWSDPTITSDFWGFRCARSMEW